MKEKRKDTDEKAESASQTTRKVEIKYPVVAILGAGATLGGLSKNLLPPPVDKDFFDTAKLIRDRGTPVVARRVMRDVFEMFGRVHGVGLEEYYREIETREAIGVIAPTQNKQRNWRGRRKDLDELIRRVYIHTTYDLDGKKPLESEAHKNLFTLLQKNTTVITFNYDMVIEENIPNTETWNPERGFLAGVSGTRSEWAEKWREQRSSDLRKRSGIILLKMHGSIGWRLYENKRIRLKDRPYSVRSGKPETVAILGPGWKKEIDKNPYMQFWGEARLRIERANTILIVGYSLPETDLMARALFAEAIRSKKAKRKWLKKLYVVDPSEEIKEKFASLFSPCLDPMGQIRLMNNMHELNERVKITLGGKEAGIGHH